MKVVTPSKAVRWMFIDNANDAPMDEGGKLFDCEVDEIPLEEQIEENEIENVFSDEKRTRNQEHGEFEVTPLHSIKYEDLTLTNTDPQPIVQLLDM